MNIRVSIVLLAIGSAPSAFAGGFVGNTLRMGSLFPDTQTPLGFQDQQLVEPGGTIFGPFNQLGSEPNINEYFATVHDTTVEFDFLYDAGWSEVVGGFNGCYIEDIFGTVDEILGVRVVSAIDYDFTQDRVVWSEDRILLNFEGLDFFETSSLVIAVDFVPSPSGTALLALCSATTLRRRQ